MSSDGQLRRCSDKALLMHHLENLVENEQCIIQESLDQTCLLFDGMAVVNEQAFYKDSINNCSDLADYFVDAIDKKSHSYAFSYVLFDNYTVKSSMKDDTRQQRTGGKSLYKPAYKVEDSTQIRDLTNFLASKKTKELLTLYLAQKVVEKCKSAVTTVTHKGVLSNQPAEHVVDLNSSQEEADTLLILYAAVIHQTGYDVHIYMHRTQMLWFWPFQRLKNWETTHQSLQELAQDVVL